jgi:DNA-binding response OmpR family regulator
MTISWRVDSPVLEVLRVAIFQLRLKLEILTRCQSSLISVYKQGYCLRHKNPSMMIESDFEVAAA